MEKNIPEIVRQCVALAFKREPATITPDTRLVEDLDMKSVNLVELLAFIEYRAGVDIPLIQAHTATTVADLTSLAKSVL